MGFADQRLLGLVRLCEARDYLDLLQRKFRESKGRQMPTAPADQLDEAALVGHHD
jgi:hypothetical protein